MANVNVTPNKGLMRKTKNELINIILRKDETEHKLSAQIEDSTKYVGNLRDKLEEKEKEVIKLKKQINILFVFSMFMCLMFIISLFVF